MQCNYPIAAGLERRYTCSAENSGKFADVLIQTHANASKILRLVLYVKAGWSSGWLVGLPIWSLVSAIVLFPSTRNFAPY